MTHGVWIVVALLLGASLLSAQRVALEGPSDSAIPAGPLGASVRRGRALLTDTRDSLPASVGNALRCASCHLDAGRRASFSWVGVFARYPQYRSRSASVETIEYRVNDCFRRSMNGKPLAADAPEMRDIIAYFAFLSTGAPVGPPTQPASAKLAKWSALRADTAHGRRLFAQGCARCHGAVGQGTPLAPPVWGANSYNLGAGMARVRTAATFIQSNMPFDAPGTLADQDAFDVAAFVDAQPRPDFPEKFNDWPNGDAPPDVAYPTRAARTADPH